MLESIHKSVNRLNLDVPGILCRFRGHLVTSEDRVVRVELHDGEQGPLDGREVALLHRDPAVEALLRAQLEDYLDELRKR